MPMPASGAAMAVASTLRPPPPFGSARRRPCPAILSWRRASSAVTASATRIGKLIETEGAVLMPGCYDALSAAIVQRSGFSAGFISGYALSASLLGKPDFGLLTPPEMAETARHVCAAAPFIPIIADADTAGGNALNVQRTVQDLIAAGAAGCFLEIKLGQRNVVIPAEEHAAKIASARDAVCDQDFFLVARTDARATSATSGLADAIARANLYMDAGADACFVEAPRDDDELREIGLKTKGYRVCNMLEGGVTPLHTPQELEDMGFHLIVHPLATLYASARALIDILKVLKESGTTKDELHKLATFEEFNDLIGLESWFELEARYSKLKTTVGAGNGSFQGPTSFLSNKDLIVEEINSFLGPVCVHACMLHFLGCSYLYFVC